MQTLVVSHADLIHCVLAVNSIYCFAFLVLLPGMALTFDLHMHTQALPQYLLLLWAGFLPPVAS